MYLLGKEFGMAAFGIKANFFCFLFLFYIAFPPGIVLQMAYIMHIPSTSCTSIKKPPAQQSMPSQ